MADVLIITHQAYVNASHSLKAHSESSWDRLVSWRGGRRLLTIIDEALANAIENSKVTVDELARVIGFIPSEIRKEYPGEVAALEQLHRVLLNLVDTQADEETTSCLVWPEHGAPSVSLAALRAAMWDQPYDRDVMKSDSPSARQRIAKRVDDLLRDAEALIDQFAYYAQSGSEHSINSSELCIPLGTPGPVVLDATARADFLWDLFEDHHQCVATPSRVRDYSNVRLHVARASHLWRAAPTPIGPGRDCRKQHPRIGRKRCCPRQSLRWQDMTPRAPSQQHAGGRLPARQAA